MPEVGLCCLSLGAALAVRKQLTTHSETAKMIGNITLWRFIYLSSVDAALKPLHSSGLAACECVFLWQRKSHLRQPALRMVRPARRCRRIFHYSSRCVLQSPV